AKALGKMYYDAMEFDKAAKVLELGRKAAPYDKDFLVELSRVYAQKSDREKQIEMLEALVPLDADDVERRVRLSTMLLEAGKAKEGEKYARQALEIDVTSKPARELLYKSLRDQKKDNELDKVKKLLEGESKKDEKK